MKSEKELLVSIVRSEAIKKLRLLFDWTLGHPIWWMMPKPNGSAPKAVKASLKISQEIWPDARGKSRAATRRLFDVLRKRSRDSRPFMFRSTEGQMHFAMPMVVSGRVVGYLGLSDMRKDIRQESLNLLSAQVNLITDNVFKSEELERLSATLRPRAVALSTVHTVHRIINSTLNLDELISRIAHLTAQVLRAEKCAIYLIENSRENLLEQSMNGKPARKPKFMLACKALAGFPKKEGDIRNFRVPKYKAVISAAKNAQYQMRKDFICAPLIDEDVIGVVIALGKKDKKPYTYFDKEILTTLAEEAVIAIKNAKTYEEQKKVTLSTIQSLAEILGTRTNSPPPQEFLRLALKMADELKLNDEESQALHYATLLKDTARVGIPDEILKKPTKLTGEEYKILKQHPFKGAKILQSFESLQNVVPIILYLREKFDGTGYPRGLKGDKIPAGARILSVISAFEAIVMGRPYRNKATWNEAVEEILRNSGTQFDPKVVDVFARRVQKEDFHKYLRA